MGSGPRPVQCEGDLDFWWSRLLLREPSHQERARRRARLPGPGVRLKLTEITIETVHS